MNTKGGTEAASTRWTSRKFWAVMFWEAVFVFLFCIDKLSETALESVTYLLLGGYLVANVAPKIASRSSQGS